MIKLFTLLSFLSLLSLYAKQPNIIFILADDVSPDMYGFYGNKEAKTPNLDKIAQEGVMFRTAWSSAICGPSRALIMTGSYANRTGAYYNGFFKPTANGEGFFEAYPSFAKLMQKEGYRTAVAGKWHVGSAEEPHEKIVGFDEYCLWEGIKQLEALPGQPKHTGLWEDDRTPSRFWGPCIIKNHHLMKTKNSDFGPDLFTEFICEFMEKSVKEEKPFLAYYPMVGPHGAREGYPTCPIYGEVGDLGSKKLEPEEKERRFRALNDYIDILVGRIKKKVQDLAIEDDTIIIYASDNGTAVTAKSRGVERGGHVIFTLKGPGIKQRGATDEIMDFSDILPTFVDWAGGSIPQNIDGRSLKPFLSGDSDSHREWIYGCTSTSQLLRTRTHLIEVMNPVMGVPGGRFYYCGTNRQGKGYVRAEKLPEHSAAQKQMRKVLQNFPALQKDDPWFQTKKGKAWLKTYVNPKAIEKHLHNHRDYKHYDEKL
ncbi:arylsulphatase A [Lentisphaera araneosa HTCC2155]|uniref:Arylsulphatase A n=1 Tax=Lentisphaera araneosa HTCC2155 TaxID=313628 RepID=A6DFG8_9BACT|nr:sulfatase-like hydrolase/transferase [Lentisphaera araneosa]EDM29548.1 arylsulphatase A [Lentisphaera araneosa HTCC2155]